jgi:predicted GH43/DUF377 family glycosyl hydrolase
MKHLLTFLIILSGVCFSQESEESQWTDYENNPVLTVGEPGTWDAGALGSMTVLKVGDTYHMYYEAWGVRSDSEWDADEYASLQIGHATSLDGITWTKDPANPVVPKGQKGSWDERGTWDPFVLYEDGKFKMWYGGGQQVCDWGYAVSEDGSNFEKIGRLSHLGGVEDNHVVHDKDAGRYYMYYWDRAYEPLGLFRAESRNETQFDFRKAVNITILDDYEEDKYKFTHVLKVENLWFMFYADFVRPHCDESKTGLALSQDGLTWRSMNQNLFNGHDAEILPINENLIYVYYGPNGYFDRKDCDIRLKIFKGEFWELW